MVTKQSQRALMESGEESRDNGMKKMSTAVLTMSSGRRPTTAGEERGITGI